MAKVVAEHRFPIKLDEMRQYTEPLEDGLLVRYEWEFQRLGGRIVRDTEIHLYHYGQLVGKWSLSSWRVDQQKYTPLYQLETPSGYELHIGRKKLRMSSEGSKSTGGKSPLQYPRTMIIQLIE